MKSEMNNYILQAAGHAIPAREATGYSIFHDTAIPALSFNATEYL